MAINADPSLPNRHVFVSAITGGGKTQAIKNLCKRLSSLSKREVFWDPDNDHKCQHYSNKQAFLVELKKLMSGRGGSIGWNGDDDESTFEWFMMCVWAALDGSKLLKIIVEEAADLNLKQKMPKWTGKVWRRARKYGGILIIGTQRVQEVPKAFITQSGETYIGIQKANDGQYIKRQTGLDAVKVGTLQPLQFYKIASNDTEFVQFKYIG